jgi:hypothetical protein
MASSAVPQRFVDESPGCVPARGLLESAFAPAQRDALCDAHAQAQQTRKLLFSTAVEVMPWVVCRARRSVHAACRHLKSHDALPASLDAVYDQLARVEPQTTRALVQHTAAEARAALEQLRAAPLALLPGYDLRAVGGNHPEGTDHRLGGLRDVGGGARPGVAVAVLDPQNRLIEDVLPAPTAMPRNAPSWGRCCSGRAPGSWGWPTAPTAPAASSSASPAAGGSSSSAGTPGTCAGGWSGSGATAAAAARGRSTSRRWS